MPFSLGFWATAGAGGGAGSDYELIQTVLGNNSSTSITFSSIPATYKHLQIRFTARSANTGFLSQGEIGLRFNSDSTSSYVAHQLTANGVTVTTPQAQAFTSLSSMLAGIMVGGGNTSDTVGVGIIDILDYLAAKNKTVRTLDGFHSDNNKGIYVRSGLWLNTAAINSITLNSPNGNWDATSRVSLYGVKG